MSIPDFQPLSPVSHDGLKPKPITTDKGGVRVLPPYSDASKEEVDLNANSEVMHEALEHAPHADLHKEVSSTNTRLKSAAKAFGTSIMNGFGRSGAFIAGTIVAAVTKVTTFSSCLGTGAASGLIMIPTAAYKHMELDKIRIDSINESISSKKAEYTALELKMDSDKNKMGEVHFPEALEAKLMKGKNTLNRLQKEITSLEVSKEKILEKMEKRKSSEWNTTAGQIRIFHHAGMASARAMEPVSKKLFTYALGGPNEKLNQLNKKTDEVLGKGGLGIGIATGNSVVVTGLGIGAILGSVVGVVGLVAAAGKR